MIPASELSVLLPCGSGRRYSVRRVSTASYMIFDRSANHGFGSFGLKSQADHAINLLVSGQDWADYMMRCWQGAA